MSHVGEAQRKGTRFHRQDYLIDSTQLDQGFTATSIISFYQIEKHDQNLLGYCFLVRFTTTMEFVCNRTEALNCQREYQEQMKV